MAVTSKTIAFTLAVILFPPHVRHKRKLKTSSGWADTLVFVVGSSSSSVPTLMTASAWAVPVLRSAQCFCEGKLIVPASAPDVKNRPASATG